MNYWKELDPNEKMLILDALNAYYREASNKLQNSDRLGTIEKSNYEWQQKYTRKLISKLEP